MSDGFILADVLASGVHDVKNDLFSAESRLLDGSVDVGAACVLIRLASTRLSNMLSAYHLLRHDLKLPMSIINVPALIQDAVLQAKESCARKMPVKVSLKFDGDWLLAREEVNDALVNALQNADRFAREQIELCVYEAERHLVFEVHDDGPGFPDHLTIGKPDEKGHGLGLFIAKHIAAHHQREHEGRWVHGSIQLSQSPLLGGALLTLRLP